MFRVIFLAIIGAIFAIILFIIGYIMFDDNHRDKPVNSDLVASDNDVESGNVSAQMSQRVYNISSKTLDNNNKAHDTKDLFQRPVTPVYNNHYRPPTPFNPRPGTPANAPPAVTPEEQFKKYNELTAVEKEGIIDLNQCTIYVYKILFDTLLESINQKGDDTTTVTYVVAYIGKSNDTQLTAPEKSVRKSFKIKNKNTDTCRYARLKVVYDDPGYYKLVFHDYTPYVGGHTPRYDVIRQEISKFERCQWIEVQASLHYNTQQININTIRILAPKKGGGTTTEQNNN